MGWCGGPGRGGSNRSPPAQRHGGEAHTHVSGAAAGEDPVPPPAVAQTVLQASGSVGAVPGHTCSEAAGRGQALQSASPVPLPADHDADSAALDLSLIAASRGRSFSHEVFTLGGGTSSQRGVSSPPFRLYRPQFFQSSKGGEQSILPPPIWVSGFGSFYTEPPHFPPPQLFAA